MAQNRAQEGEKGNTSLLGGSVAHFGDLSLKLALVSLQLGLLGGLVTLATGSLHISAGGLVGSDGTRVQKELLMLRAVVVVTG